MSQNNIEFIRSLVDLKDLNLTSNKDEMAHHHFAISFQNSEMGTFLYNNMSEKLIKTNIVFWLCTHLLLSRVEIQKC